MDPLLLALVAIALGVAMYAVLGGRAPRGPGE
jgi:hypothetical protein